MRLKEEMGSEIRRMVAGMGTDVKTHMRWWDCDRFNKNGRAEDCDDMVIGRS